MPIPLLFIGQSCDNQKKYCSWTCFVSCKGSYKSCLGWWAQWIECRYMNQRVTGVIPSQDLGRGPVGPQSFQYASASKRLLRCPWEKPETAQSSPPPLNHVRLATNCLSLPDIWITHHHKKIDPLTWIKWMTTWRSANQLNQHQLQPLHTYSL